MRDPPLSYAAASTFKIPSMVCARKWGLLTLHITTSYRLALEVPLKGLQSVYKKGNRQPAPMLGWLSVFLLVSASIT